MRVLLMRVALYGAVLAVGAALLSARAGADDERAFAGGPPVRSLYGDTSEGAQAMAKVRAGRVEHLMLRWEMRCSRDRSPAPSTITFHSFQRDGRGFSVSRGQELAFRDGTTLRYRPAVTGRLAADGRSASGRGALVETWYRDGRVIDRCRSGDVSWSVGPGMRTAS